jgi:predicted site-specific integrase-resolvase
MDITMSKYITPQEAQNMFGFHPKTLNRWALAGKIEFIKSPGGHARYSIDSLQSVSHKEDNRKIILYARVSTGTQKDDLASQADYVSKAYPQARIITDIGSGMNFKRKKFIDLMEQVSRKEIKLIVVAHKDRLARFGFEFIEWFCNINGCTIEVLNHTYKTPHAELVDDFMAIMHCFSSKLYFLRRYKDDIKKDIDTGADKTDKQH